MKIFLIIVAVLALIIIAILSLSATVTIVYDKKWSTKVSILFIEKEIQLSKILSFILFPEEKAKEVSENNKKKNDKNNDKQNQKPNPIKNLWDNEGIVGIMSLVSNLIETVNSAVLTLFRGLHIYSLYVMILVGGLDADAIARSYGILCKYYYPIKGMILNGMKVDNYDDCIHPDFLAGKTEFEFQFIGSINVALILKVGLKAGFIFLKNLIKNKKGD